MTFSAGFKAMLARDVWASSDVAAVETPEDAGLRREDGWGIAYEQIGSGKYPERAVFNNNLQELSAAFADIATQGVPRWSADLDYEPTDSAACFVTTTTGLHVTFTNSGPGYGNATDPDAVGQIMWRRY